MDFILAEETRNEVAAFMEKVEQCGKWPEQACTTMFFLILKNITSERPIALMPTMIRWCEALRASEMAKWHYKYRIEWDTTDRRNGGGAQRTVWEIRLEATKKHRSSLMPRNHCGRHVRAALVEKLALGCRACQFLGRCRRVLLRGALRGVSRVIQAQQGRCGTYSR